MEYWYDIVKSYDDPKTKDPKKKDDGTFSQLSVVILLVYLSFGEGYPYSIAEFFKKSFYRPLDPDITVPYCSNLRTTKVGTLLNNMSKDGLLIRTIKKVCGKDRRYYSINPQIIQSPIKGETYFLQDGSIFEIPLELTKQLLDWTNWSEEASRAVCEREEFFRIVVYPDTIDYLLFLEFLKIKAYYKEKVILENKKCDTSTKLEFLIKNYIRELEEDS
jgi:hypothetical protein